MVLRNAAPPVGRARTNVGKWGGSRVGVGQTYEGTFLRSIKSSHYRRPTRRTLQRRRREWLPRLGEGNASKTDSTGILPVLEIA